MRYIRSSYDRKSNKHYANLHLARGGELRQRDRWDTTNGDRDVEGQVVAVVGGDVYTALNTTERTIDEADQLNLTEEVLRASGGTGESGLDGLAHVTENDVATSSVVGLSNERGKTSRAGVGGGHRTRGVVANNVAGVWDELIDVAGRSGGDDIGGLVEHIVGLDLTNETGNG